MGVLDFLKVGKEVQRATPTKQAGVRSVKHKGKLESCGVITFDSFSFNIRDYNLRGFIIDPYDKDLLIKGQRFRFDIKVTKEGHKMEGRGEAMVTKISGNALAAAFTIKPFGTD